MNLVNWKLYYNSVEKGLNCNSYDNGGGQEEDVKIKISTVIKGKLELRTQVKL